MTYKVTFDNDDFVDGGTSPNKINGGAAIPSSTNFGAAQIFNGQLINSKNIFLPYTTISGPNGGNYDSSATNMYVTSFNDYVLRADFDGQIDSVVLYNKAVGDIVIFKNTFGKGIGIWGSLYGGGTINNATGTWPSTPPINVGVFSFATFLCVASNTWITI